MPTISLTIDTANAQRIATAFGRYWNLVDANGNPRDATLAEIKTFLTRQVMGVVRNQDHATAAAAAAASATDVVIS